MQPELNHYIEYLEKSHKIQNFLKKILKTGQKMVN